MRQLDHGPELLRFFAIAFGSNLGDRQYYLDTALAIICRMEGMELVATSAIFESKGWGKEDLEPFLNAVAVVKSQYTTPPFLLRKLQRIEDLLGRTRDEKWGPRTLDLDLLACNNESWVSEGLTLPHPWIKQRPFVYLPLAQVADCFRTWKDLSTGDEEGQKIEKDSTLNALPHPVWGSRFSPSCSSIELETASEEETLELAKSLAPYLFPGDTIALEAPMGSGKSVFARGIARGLAIEGPIPSPSYTLCYSYDGPHQRLEHWDFYRLSEDDELESTGFYTPESEDAIRVIEWAENFPEAIGTPLMTVHLTPIDAERRSIRLEAPEGRTLPSVFTSIINHHTEKSS